MPSKLASWKEQDIMKGRIERMEFTNLLQTTATSIQDDVSSFLSVLITISRKNDCYLVGCVCGQIITAMVCITIKAKGNFTLLVWSHVLSELISLLVQLDCRMATIKHVLEGLHGCSTER